MTLQERKKRGCILFLKAVRIKATHKIFQIKYMMAVPPLCEELVALEEWLDQAEQQLFAQ